MNQTIVLTFSEKLDCGNCDKVFLWLFDPLLLSINDGVLDPNLLKYLVIGTITDVTCISSTSWQYTVTYDGDVLLNLDIPLTECDIKRLCCASCFLEYVHENMGGGTLCILDTPTIDFQITELGCITGDVKISADEGNEITAHADGIYAPTGGGGGGDAWLLLGNAGTIDGTNFLGTIDDVPWDLRVNNHRGFRVEPPNAEGTGPNTFNTVNIINGSEYNSIINSDDIGGNAILSGGSHLANANSIDGTAGNVFGSVICGGNGNFLQVVGTSFIGGGDTNSISSIDDPSDPTGQSTVSVIVGGFQNISWATEHTFIGAGANNAISYVKNQPSDQFPAQFSEGDTIGGGYGNDIVGDSRDIPTSEDVPTSLGYNSIIGGNGDSITNSLYGVVAGGNSNAIGVNENFDWVIGIWYANAILGGQSNYLLNCARGFVGGGTFNTQYGTDSSSIVGGYLNQITQTTPLPPLGNPTSQIVSPPASIGVGNAILGGEGNEILDGWGTSILGGAFLKLGKWSLGYQSPSTRDFTDIDSTSQFPTLPPPTTIPAQVDLTAFNNVAFFGDVDLWIGNTDAVGRALKIFAPNADETYAAAIFSSFECTEQTFNIRYILPSAAGVANQVLTIDSVAGTTVFLKWA